MLIPRARTPITENGESQESQGSTPLNHTHVGPPSQTVPHPTGVAGLSPRLLTCMPASRESASAPALRPRNIVVMVATLS